MQRASRFSLCDFSGRYREYDARMNEGEVVERLRTALAMFDLGESIMRQNLRRADPEASEQDIEARLRVWLLERPGAEHGDAPGRLRPVPE
jgi:hypothetical protein